MPSGPIEDENGVAAGGHLRRDFGQVLVHGQGVGAGHDKGGADVASRTDRAEDIGPGIARVLHPTRTVAFIGPNIGESSLLSDARLVLPP